MARATVAALVPTTLSAAQWQDAVDEADFLVPVLLTADQPRADRDLWKASLDGETVVFRFARRVTPLPISARADLAPYVFTLSTPDDEDLKPSAVGFAALYAYVSRTSGLFYNSLTGETRSAFGLKKHADSLLAAASNRLEAYLERYPEDREPNPGPGAVYVKVHW